VHGGSFAWGHDRRVICEIVAIGTELLLGQIVDTNGAWLGEQLALAGIDVHHQVKVGDNHGRIVDALALALSRADAVLVCGGLGPTQDDITREAIAAVLGVGLVPDDDVAARIRAMFEARGRRMPENNLRQALVPAGAVAIADPQPGTAPGLICPVPGSGGAKVIYAVPGVPRELHAIVSEAILPDLRRRAGAASVIASRTLRTWGESESGLAERLAGRISALDSAGNPTIAFLASGMEGIKVRITAKGPSAAAVDALLAAEEAELRALLGPLVFGVDAETMESVVVGLLDARGWTIGLAESMTGGLLASRLTDVPGVSGVFLGSVVSYASAVKFDVLGVPIGPVVSAPAAEAMAQGARRVLGTDVGLAVTGVAGPAEQEGEPVGTVFVGLAVGDGPVESLRLGLPGERRTVRELAVISALDLLRRRLQRDP
jgi:nicotinamide-nucleotide amidase